MRRSFSKARLAVGELRLLCTLVSLALLHGALYLALVPPWQHYDETAHFLYAAEIAAGELVAPGAASVAISREIADSMYRLRFFEPTVRPDLFGPLAPSVGISQRVHPPTYYAIVALPLRMFSATSIEQQLYIARTVSLFFYVLTLVAAWRIAVVLAPDEMLMQWLLPLLVLLAPAFADIMTAVNNDVLLNFSATVALLGAIMLVRDGIKPFPLALALLGIVAAFLAKRVAAVVFVPLILALCWSVQRAPLRWWVMPLLAISFTTLSAVTTLEPVLVDGPSGAYTVLALRPWFAGLSNDYLRLDLRDIVRSMSDITLVGNRYETLLLIGFAGFWGHFAWGAVMLPAFWTWIMAVLALMATIGLLVGYARGNTQVHLWQVRCLWLFLVAVVIAWFSLFVRLHPLPPLDVPVYIPRGRYMFWAIVPNLWLLAVGLAGIAPATWRRGVLYALLVLFVCLDLSAWGGTIVSAHYR